MQTPEVRIVWNVPQHSIRRVVVFKHGPEHDPQYDRLALAVLFERIRSNLPFSKQVVKRCRRVMGRKTQTP